MGAYDVHAARLFGSVVAKTGIVPFMELAELVITLEPFASARRVYWIVNNRSSHYGQRSIDRMGAARPNTRLVRLPVHASWLNQIEVVFSVIQRKVIKPDDFSDLAALADGPKARCHSLPEPATPRWGGESAARIDQDQPHPAP